jgi:glycogen(starch) synthase
VRVLVVSGIWPPYPGGPASHASALADYLSARGHDVEAVTTASETPTQRGYGVHWIDRRSRLRHVRAAALVAARARHADVVYATSMVRRAALGSLLARTPLVVKLVSDEVYERATRSGRYPGTLDAFQSERGLRWSVLRRTRDAALRRACRVLSPSAYLRSVALGWGLDERRLTVVANPPPDLPPLQRQDDARASLQASGPLLVFAGRLAPQKSLGVLLEAVARLPQVTLVVAGDGPERALREQQARELGVADRVRFLGSVPRDEVLGLFRAADASVLPSSWENYPHTVVEALAVGCPVVATNVGGVPEVVRDGENGLLVPAGDVDALASALARVLGDDELRERLARAAPPSVAGRTEASTFGEIEAILAGCAR